MLKWLIKRRIAAFEREYGYDSGYIRDMLDADVRAALVFNRVMPLARYQHDVPTDAWYAAKLVTTLSEDCGPCTQLVVTMAERAGMEPGLIRAVLIGEEKSLTPDAALGYRFAKATLTHDPQADVLRDDILRRWGARALVSLSFAVTAARIFPTVKYALGHGKACQRVVVGDAAVPILRRAA